MVFGHFGMILGSFGDRWEIVLGWFWDGFDMVLVSFCYGFAMVLVWFCDGFGVVPGPFRGRSGSILEWFGMVLGCFDGA